MIRATYEIVESESTPDRLVIRDVGHHTRMTITNDAENVVADLVANGHLYADRRLYYYDSDDALCEIITDRGRFRGFGIPH